MSCLLVFLAFLQTVSPAVGSENPFQAPLGESEKQWVAQTLESMTLEEQVGQVIFVGLKTPFTNLKSESFAELRKDLQRHSLGGVHLFSGDVLSAALLVRRAQDLSKQPLLITADLEGGAGLILDGATRFPKAMALAATADPQNAYTVGKITAIEARNIGIHINFYPVVDVNNNPQNPIINIRSFGEDPNDVGRFASAYIQGLQDHGVMATAKHFPGHGDTAVDSHLELPIIETSRERLEEVELPPFRSAVEAGVGAIMTAHLYLPALEPTPGLPATLSSRIISGLLKEELGFKGLVFTDAMSMSGIANHYSDGEAAVRALEAGADIILLPRSAEKAHQGILRAMTSGRISKERLQESVRKILEVKAQMGLHRNRAPELFGLDEIVADPEHQELSQKIMDEAITLVRDSRGALPFSPRRQSSLLVVTLLDERRNGERRSDEFVRQFLSRYPKSIHVEISHHTSSADVRLLMELSKRVDYLVVGAFVRVAAYRGTVDLSAGQLEFLKQMAQLDRPSVFVVFGSPYLLSMVPEIPAYVLAYEDFAGAEAAAVRAILGISPFKGKLPVSLPELHPIGTGLQND